MMRKRRTCIVIATLIFVLTAVSIYFGILSEFWDDYEVPLRASRLFDLEDTFGYTGKKKILFWNSIFGDNWFYMGKSGHFDHCPKYKNCYATRFRGLVDVASFDAILFHGNEISRWDLPGRRDPKQIYVFVSLESPMNEPVDDTFFEDYFNMTMTYRLDSDLPWPYRILRNIETGEIVAPSQSVAWANPKYDYLKLKDDLKIAGKKKMAAWLVSNCNTHGKRELYVEELRKHMQVDVMGACGDNGRPECSISRDCFTEMIELEYFFYLSFENTLCEDYVTEKFFKALRHNVIPVVYGGANYSLFAPPHSYIDALDFESPKALANFLIKLSQDHEEYLKYFWWKRIYSVNYTDSSIMCRLCEFVNEPKPPKTYSPLSDWLSKDKCPIHDFLKGNKFATKDLRSLTNGLRLT